jgi:hypothetical protein
MALLAVAACAAAGCSTVSAARSASSLPAPITILQENIHLLANPAATIDVARSLGVDYMRVFIGWAAFAPSPASRHRPAGFDATNPAAYPAAAWAPYDAIVRAAAARRVGIFFLLTGAAPLWATTPPPKGTNTNAPGVFEPNAQQFGRFVTAVATRYDGSYTPPGATAPLPKVRFWSVWNEPNYGPDLQPQALRGVEVSPRIYRGLLDSAWSALHATGHGSDTILFGETAPRGATVPGVANGMRPLRFIRALYCVDASFHPLTGSAAAARGCPTTGAGSRAFPAAHPVLFQATGFAVHMYTSGQVSAPSLPSPAGVPDTAGLYDIPILENTLDRVTAAYGSTKRFPIYNTEFGFQTNPPANVCGCVFLAPTTAAYYMNWSEYLTWSNRRIHSYAQYLLYDGAVPGHPNLSSFSSGLLFANGTPKPGYAAFRLPLYLPVTTQARRHALQVWGAVRPAAYAGGSPQRALIQFRRASGGGWSSLRAVTITNSAGYFEVHVLFPASGRVRLQWTYPKAFASLPAGTPRTVTSRTQTITIH